MRRTLDSLSAKRKPSGNGLGAINGDLREADSWPEVVSHLAATYSVSMLLLASDDQSERLARSTAAQHPPQQGLLLKLLLCRAVYGLTLRKGRSGMLRRQTR